MTPQPVYWDEDIVEEREVYQDPPHLGPFRVRRSWETKTGTWVDNTTWCGHPLCVVVRDDNGEINYIAAQVLTLGSPEEESDA